MVLDALLADRLAFLCGAGLSMAAPSCVPSAAELAENAKKKYDATYGGDRSALPLAMDEQTQFFFERGELATVYLRTYVDRNAFAAQPNAGHFAVADLMLISGISTAVSTNVGHANRICRKHVVWSDRGRSKSGWRDESACQPIPST